MADVSHYNVLVGKKYCFNEIFAGNEYVVANIILIMSSGVEKWDIKGLIDNVSVTNIICIYVFNKHCDMDFLHRNILRYGFSGRYSPLVFTIYGHGGNLGHVTWIIYIYIGNPFLLMLNIKLSFDWPRGFREDV